MAMTPSEQTVLDRRAQGLARPRRRTKSRHNWRRVLVFTLLGKPYGVDLDRLEAIIRIGDIYPVPMTPPHLQGIIRRQGQSITLVSLRHFFDRGAEGVYDADYALIVGAGSKRFAIQAEDVDGVLRLDPEAVRPPPDNMDPSQRPYVSGVTADGVVILSMESLVAADHFAAGQPGRQRADPRTQERP